MPEIFCPVCGKLSKDDVVLYNSKLRRQNFNISPIYPTCKKCGADVKIQTICHGGQIIILNGTCGSGKSTIAEELMKQYGYYIIDGDCAMQAVKHKLGITKISTEELLAEIAREIDYISLFSTCIVFSHIILSEDMMHYCNIFSERNLDYQFYLLQPQIEECIRRCQGRTCHSQVTPEYWIRHFHEQLTALEGVTTIDNTNLSIQETVLKICKSAAPF